jgi:hypothetical protein
MSRRADTRWLWRRPAGCGAVEAHARQHLVLDDLGRQRRQLAGGLVVAGRDLGGHAEAEVGGVGLGNLEFDFHRRQVHQRHQRAVRRHHAAIRDRQAADDAVDRRAQLQFVDAALGVVERQLRALQLGLLGLQFQRDVLAFQFRGGARVFRADLGGLQRVLRLLEIVLGDHADAADALHALEGALGGGAFDLGLVGVAAGDQFLLVGQDHLARHFGLQLRIVRLLALELVGQVRRLEFGDDLAFLDRIAGVDLQRDGGRRGRVQRRADGGDDAAVHGRVAHQRADADPGGAQARRVDGMGAAAPGLEQPGAGDQHGDGRCRNQRIAPVAGLVVDGHDLVLAGSISYHRCPGKRYLLLSRYRASAK